MNKKAFKTVNLIDIMQNPKKDLKLCNMSIKDIGYGAFISCERFKKEIKENNEKEKDKG